MAAYIYPTHDDPPKVIDLKDIDQTYNNGASFVLQNLNFALLQDEKKGKFISLLGASGSGKSTILRYISGLQTPSSGSILVNGVPPGKKNRVAMVFQEYSSMPWYTVLDNVSLALDYKGISKQDRYQQAMEMIELVGLTGHESKYAQIPALSGGQLQRVAIARSLLANNRILLMDEPFGALDINTRLQMQDLLLSIQEKFKMYVVFVTHDISEAVYLSDTIYMMKTPPSRIVLEQEINLPEHRTHELKRSVAFMDYVHSVEDSMIKLSEKV